MKRTPRREEIPFLHKLYFVLALLAIPIGLGGIAGGIVLIIINTSDIAAVFGSVVVFVSFCCVSIPIGTCLFVLHLRLRCENGLVITKSYIDVTKPRPRSFRSFDGGDVASAGGTVVGNPYAKDGGKPQYSILLRNYHDVGKSDPQDDIRDGQTAHKVEEVGQAPQHDLPFGSTSKRQRKRMAPPAPQTTADLYKINTVAKQSPRLGKPVPVPVAPAAYYNQTFDESEVKSQVNDSSKIDESQNSQMTVSVEIFHQEYTESQISPQNNTSQPQNTLPQNGLVLPPRNVSTLYPSMSPSNSAKYEEMGTRM